MDSKGRFKMIKLPKAKEGHSLIESLPVFKEPILDFKNCHYDIESDPALSAKLASERRCTDDLI